MEEDAYAKHLLDPEHSNVIAEGYVRDCTISMFDHTFDTYQISPTYRADIQIMSLDVSEREIKKIQASIMPVVGSKLRKVMIVLVEE
jgi:flagellar basal body rod protein FlgC